jgi:hypothetical protein
MSWLNNDKLLLKFGTEKATSTPAGEYSTLGQLHEVEIKIDLTALTQTETILADVTSLPKNARLAELVVLTHTAAATGTAIDIGLIRMTDRTTEIDYDGILAAFPIASMNAAGETTVLTAGSSGAGALVGTTLSQIGMISGSRTDATAFTAGVIYLKIRYYMT